MLKNLLIFASCVIFLEEVNGMMESPCWKSVSDPRSEAFHDIEKMKQHMTQYNENLIKVGIITPETASILWAAYKSAGNTLASASVLSSLLEFYKTDQKLGIDLLMSQYDNSRHDLKIGYDEAIVGDALSLIKDRSQINPYILKTLKQDGWFD